MPVTPPRAFPTAREGRNTLVSQFAVTGPVVDGGNGVNVGTSCWCGDRVFTSANVDTQFPHSLGRAPNGFWGYRNGSGGIIYDPSDGKTRWTASTVWLRVTVAGTYSFVLM